MQSCGKDSRVELSREGGNQEWGSGNFGVRQGWKAEKRDLIGSDPNNGEEATCVPLPQSASILLRCERKVERYTTTCIDIYNLLLADITKLGCGHTLQSFRHILDGVFAAIVGDRR